MDFGIAWRAVWRILSDDAFATKVEGLMGGEKPAARPIAKKVPAIAPPPPKVAPVAVPPRVPPRSEALTLLAVLQREGRLVDFLKEPIAGYSDAQIGAAVRDIHRDCAAALDRVFSLKPVLDQPDGSPVDVPAGFDAGKYKLTGNVAGAAPFRGTLRHPGWVASHALLPEWSGQVSSANVVAPAEVEIA